jgi:hypothetical protein
VVVEVGVQDGTHGDFKFVVRAETVQAEGQQSSFHPFSIDLRTSTSDRFGGFNEKKTG